MSDKTKIDPETAKAAREALGMDDCTMAMMTAAVVSAAQELDQQSGELLDGLAITKGEDLLNPENQAYLREHFRQRLDMEALTDRMAASMKDARGACSAPPKTKGGDLPPMS